MRQESFADALVRASKAEGSLLALALRLEVAPAIVYRWIAMVEQPSEEERRRLHGLLCRT